MDGQTDGWSAAHLVECSEYHWAVRLVLHLDYLWETRKAERSVFQWAGMRAAWLVVPKAVHSVEWMVA